MQTRSDRGPTPTRATNVVRTWSDGELHVPDRADVLPWELALERLGTPTLYWHTTQRPGAAPHVRPVFAVISDGVLCSTSSATARKTALMREQPRCTLATSSEGMDLVYEGRAREVDDPAALRRIVDAYHAKYGWPVEPAEGGRLRAPFAAPAAGPPPFLAFAFEPDTVRAFGTDERHADRSTRWDFER